MSLTVGHWESWMGDLEMNITLVDTTKKTEQQGGKSLLLLCALSPR
jgi:hypothetical protein